MSINGKIKCVDSRVNVHNLASTSVPITLMTAVQVPNLALTHKKWITVLTTEFCRISILIPFCKACSALKGTVSRDFLLPVFFMNQFPPSPRLSH